MENKFRLGEKLHIRIHVKEEGKEELRLVSIAGYRELTEDGPEPGNWVGLLVAGCSEEHPQGHGVGLGCMAAHRGLGVRGRSRQGAAVGMYRQSLESSGLCSARGEGRGLDVLGVVGELVQLCSELPASVALVAAGGCASALSRGCVADVGVAGVAVAARSAS